MSNCFLSLFSKCSQVVNFVGSLHKISGSGNAMGCPMPIHNLHSPHTLNYRINRLFLAVSLLRARDIDNDNVNGDDDDDGDDDDNDDNGRYRVYIYIVWRAIVYVVSSMNFYCCNKSHL